MKKAKATKLTLVALMLSFVVAFVAACGGGGPAAPSWIVNPPATPAALETLLEANDWINIEIDPYGDDTSVTAEKNSFGEVDIETLPDNQQVTLQQVYVTYFADEASAIFYYTFLRTIIEVAVTQIPGDITLVYGIWRNGNIVSQWLHESGTAAAIRAFNN